jgi:sortase (surface protein transpeptidase)
MRRLVASTVSLFRGSRGRLTVAAVLFLASAVLLATGLVSLLTTSGTESAQTNVGSIPIYPDRLAGTFSVSPTPTPPSNDSPVVRMVIDRIGVDAPVMTLGLDEDHVPEVPDDPYTVVWYDFSSKPGWGSNAVFSGHVDWIIGGQPVTGVFYYLRDLRPDDVVEVILEDGTEYRYRVTANEAIRADDPKALEVMGATPTDAITLITCGGTWVPDPSNPLGGQYTHRQIVRAELMEEQPPAVGALPS